MISNLKTLMIVALVATLPLVVSCKKEKIEKAPKVELKEVGHDNSKVAHPGHDMHVEADMEAEAGISKVVLEIHGHGEGTFKMEKVYDEFNGKKNAEFHKHIDIPADAKVGEYHLHLTVVDMNKKSTTAEAHFDVQTALE